MLGWSNDEPTLNSDLSVAIVSGSLSLSGRSSFMATRRVVSLSSASQIWVDCPEAMQLISLYLPIVRLSLDTKCAPRATTRQNPVAGFLPGCGGSLVFL